MKYLYEKPAILKALNDATGFDFTSFFDMYVFGTVRLPLRLVGGRPEIIQSEMSTIDRIPTDSDRDGLYGEDDLNDPDTHNDGLFDGEEVHGYRTIFVDGVRNG